MRGNRDLGLHASALLQRLHRGVAAAVPCPRVVRAAPVARPPAEGPHAWPTHEVVFRFRSSERDARAVRVAHRDRDLRRSQQQPADLAHAPACRGLHCRGKDKVSPPELFGIWRLPRRGRPFANCPTTGACTSRLRHLLIGERVGKRRHAERPRIAARGGRKSANNTIRIRIDREFHVDRLIVAERRVHGGTPRPFAP